MNDPALEQDIQTFWALLFEIVADVEKRLAAHMGAHGLTPPQFYVLKTLHEHGGSCRIGQIAVEHHLTSATMTGLVKRLEAMNPPLVRRERSGLDARSVDVLLTEAGTERFWDVQRSLMEQARGIFSIMPEAERQETIAKVRFYFELLRQQFPVDKNHLPGVQDQ